MTSSMAAEPAAMSTGMSVLFPRQVSRSVSRSWVSHSSQVIYVSSSQSGQTSSTEAADSSQCSISSAK